VGKLFKIRRQWFRMFSPHSEYLRSSLEFCNKKWLNSCFQQCIFAEILAAKLSRVCRQWLGRFPHTQITFRAPKNVGTLATKIIAHGMVILPEM